MRGKQYRAASTSVRVGITPADAGKTPQLRHLAQIQSGSPPRMRGKHELEQNQKASGRITPADAGKTTIREFGLYSWEDHPRGCGENMLYQALFAVAVGSPPRMRGKLFVPPIAYDVFGITPADAGKTCQELSFP